MVPAPTRAAGGTRVARGRADLALFPGTAVPTASPEDTVRPIPCTPVATHPTMKNDP